MRSKKVSAKKGSLKRGLKRGLITALVGLSAVSHAQTNIVVRNKAGDQVGVIRSMPAKDPLAIPTNSVALYESLARNYKGNHFTNFERTFRYPAEIAAKRAFLALLRKGLAEKEIRQRFKYAIDEQCGICESIAKSANKHGISFEDAMKVMEYGYWQPIKANAQQ